MSIQGTSESGFGLAAHSGSKNPKNARPRPPFKGTLAVRLPNHDDRGDAQGRSLGRTATAVKNLSPGYFSFVMATSIISTGSFLLGPS